MEIKATAKKRGAGKTVLVVDDTPRIRELFLAAFSSDGFKTYSADNGKEAIDLARKIRPDIIVLDLSMPGMNGIEAAAELRKILPKTPVILSTIHEGTVSAAAAAKAGIDVVLPKSMPLRLIIDKAHELIKTRFDKNTI